MFVYQGATREVVLENDCRAYPLRVRATFEADAAAGAISAFQAQCEYRYGCAFRTPLPGAEHARIPQVAVKIGLYRALDTVEVHFYKDSPHADRRRLIGWLVTANA